MTDGADSDDIDVGEPIAELAVLEELPTEGFFERIRGGILRRVAGGHALEFGLEAFAEFLKAIGDLLFGWSAPSSRSKDDE